MAALFKQKRLNVFSDRDGEHENAKFVNFKFEDDALFTAVQRAPEDAP